MLDENLPCFYVKPSTEKPKSHSTLYTSQGGLEPQPAYGLRHLDPSSPNSRNRYAVALYDSFCPDALYAEVLLVPKWTHPTQEAIRANGGIKPPPEPILPTEFVVQLYNPDHQVLVRYKSGTWNSSATWSFEMPQQTFRQPSISQLDRTMSDPAASETTSKLRFNWRKDGKLSKDLSCYLSGKVVDPDGASKKSKEPDITIAIFQALREITLYEPNLYRVDMEDFKGLEVVLMLSAIVIRDVYFGQMKECFHVTDPPSNPTTPVERPAARATTGSANGPPRITTEMKPPPQPPRRQQQPPANVIPPADPRTQWEIDEESKRLKQQTEIEERERRRKEKESEKQTKKLLEAEQKKSRKRQEQVDKETERLRKLYGKEEKQYRNTQQQQGSKPVPPPRPQPQQQQRQSTSHNPRHASYSTPPSTWGQQFSHARPQAPTSNSGSQLLSPNHTPSTAGGLKPPQQQLKERKSIFGFLKKDEGQSNTLTKKRSSMF